MPNIIGREAEIAQLDTIFNQTAPAFVAVYGRRRVGKTYLIDEYFKDKCVYFEMTGSKKASKSAQLMNFHREYSILFPTNATEAVPKDWHDALYRLHLAISAIDENQKVTLFFDELPWLASPRSGFLSALEYMWNRHYSRRKNLTLVVCGSAAAWMIKKIINDKEGFYGRLTHIMPLYPFKLNEAEQLLQAQNVQFERQRIVELFMVTGGIGAYLARIKAGESVTQSINNLCFKANGALFLEFNNLFQSLFEHSEKHIQIVRTLAKHRHGLTQRDLFKQTKLSQSGRTTEALEELEMCGFITTLPSFDNKKKARKFRLIDEYSVFYLTWIEPEYATIMRGSDDEYWYKLTNSPAWASWSGYAFETLCFKHIDKIKQALGIRAVKTVESHWRYISEKGSGESGAEIDLIIDRADGCINLCEIKFTRTPLAINKAMAENLQRKREIFQVQTGTKKSIFITLITVHGLVSNAYVSDVVQSQVVLDDLF